MRPSTRSSSPHGTTRTRRSSCRRWRQGKPVFVEKPLCLTLDELAAIEAAYARAKRPMLMVGFNRRFAPHVQRIKTLLAGTGPKSFVMTVNAGTLARDHWTRDREIGGGRIVGEACHFIDLLRYLAGSPIASKGRIGRDAANDTVTLNLTFEDGSIGTIHYFANGSRAFAKERLEVFADGTRASARQLQDAQRLWRARFSPIGLVAAGQGPSGVRRRFLDRRSIRRAVTDSVRRNCRSLQNRNRARLSATARGRVSRISRACCACMRTGAPGRCRSGTNDPR